ncbi:hypothetical protein CMI37_19545 [Candidatus Pacearchaeota archaeon]|nr:hypothetical protein [Candidatus Pacearchaeota archaeon]|tara:strand:+ start:2140 stop:2565 length:426 start_codon:yes stop_codon:yes gene_type:complete
MVARVRNPHITGKILAIDLPSNGMIGLQSATAGKKVAYIPNDFTCAEGNAEAMVMRWNSWEHDGLVQRLLEALEDLPPMPNVLATMPVIVEAREALDESRAKGKYITQGALGEHYIKALWAIVDWLDDTDISYHNCRTGTA